MGPVGSLAAQATDDAIEITWSPPNIPTESIVYYEVTYQRVNSGESNDDLMTTVTTESVSLSIPASQGDQYSVTVTAHTETGPGDSSTITARVDCEKLLNVLSLDGKPHTKVLCKALLVKDITFQHYEEAIQSLYETRVYFYYAVVIKFTTSITPLQTCHFSCVSMRLGGVLIGSYVIPS